MQENVTVSFLQLGAGYVIAAAEAFAIVFLFFRLDAKDKVIANRDVIIAALQKEMVDRGIAMTEKVIEAIKDQTNSNLRVTEVVAGLNTFIQNTVWRKK